MENRNTIEEVTYFLEKEEWDDMDDTSFDDIFDDLN
jgi:hypothetical protein